MIPLVTRHEYRIAKKLSRDPLTRPDHAEAYKHVCRLYKGHWFDFNTALCAKGMDLLGCKSQDDPENAGPAAYPVGARVRVSDPRHMFDGRAVTIADNGTLPSRWPYLDGPRSLLTVRLDQAHDAISSFVIAVDQVAPIDGARP